MRQTEAVLKFLEPQVVFLELCSDRLDCLMAPKVPTMEEMREMWKKNKDPLEILSKWFRTKLRRWHGGEFFVAFEEAMRYGGIVILGDRPSKITRERLWVKKARWELIKLMAGPIFMGHAILLSSAEALRKKASFFESLNQVMNSHYPTIVEVLIHERDQYMSAKLLKVARKHNCVVAIVGRDHLSGIQKNWKQPVDMKALLHRPTKDDV